MAHLVVFGHVGAPSKSQFSYFLRHKLEDYAKTKMAFRHWDRNEEAQKEEE